MSSYKYTSITDAGIRATNSQYLTIGKLIMQFATSDINEPFTKEIDFSSEQRLSMSGINRKSRFEGKNFYNGKGLIRRYEKKIKSYNSLSSQSQVAYL